VYLWQRTGGRSPDRALTRAPERLERDLPLLGICRGMQLLNVACGGTLAQHLPDDAGHGDHRRALGSFVGADHDVRLAEGRSSRAPEADPRSGIVAALVEAAAGVRAAAW
jgi:anthranilate/para-aminobenzoate synthase component II